MTNREAVKAVVTVPEKVGLAIVGEVPNTTDPDPVSSDKELANTEEAAVVVRLLDPSVKTALEAVSPEKVIVPDEVIPVAPVIAPAPVMAIDGVFK